MIYHQSKAYVIYTLIVVSIAISLITYYNSTQKTYGNSIPKVTTGITNDPDPISMPIQPPQISANRTLLFGIISGGAVVWPLRSVFSYFLFDNINPSNFDLTKKAKSEELGKYLSNLLIRFLVTFCGIVIGAITIRFTEKKRGRLFVTSLDFMAGFTISLALTVVIDAEKNITTFNYISRVIIGILLESIVICEKQHPTNPSTNPNNSQKILPLSPKSTQ